MTETTPTTAPTVVCSIDVQAPPSHVFETFTQRMQTWWEPTHHLIPDVVEMRVEPTAGGTITDIGANGETCTWGRVLAYEPPDRFVFSWDISPQWELERDPARCSEVEVTFTPLGSSSTRVELTHRHLDRHGEGWESVAGAIEGPNGWPLGLGRLAAVS